MVGFIRTKYPQGCFVLFFARKLRLHKEQSTQMKSAEVMSNDLLIEAVNLKNGARIFRAVNHSLRQKMLRQLHLKGKMTVTEIFVTLRIEQSLASQHLAILRKANFVTTERSGKFIYYALNHTRLNQIHEVT